MFFHLYISKKIIVCNELTVKSFILFTVKNLKNLNTIKLFKKNKKITLYQEEIKLFARQI